MLARVSELESFRRWRADPDASVDEVVAMLRHGLEPTEGMLAGTAFHALLEHAKPGELVIAESQGFTFHFAEDAEIVLPTVRELRAYKAYGELTVTGQVDGLFGRRVEDHKTTAHFNADRYLEGYQWRFYLDIFEADLFRWNVFEIKPVPKKARVYEVAAPQVLEQARYAGMADDCASLAHDFLAFARIHVPERFGRRAA